MGILQRIRISSIAPQFPTYAHVESLQSTLQTGLLEYKASLSSPSPKKAPPPSLISFTPAPTYTLGRRQVGPLPEVERARLRAPLRVRYHAQGAAHGKGVTTSETRNYKPEVLNAPRGGLATYHGPGQVVFWPVIDLHSPHHKHFSVRDYACLLEKTTIAALERVTARGDTLPETGRTKPLKGFTTDNPGVWVEHSPSGLWSAKSSVSSPQSSGEERKISALGVHLRRHVTGLGVAINVSMPIAGREAINPWGRIVACGLEDRRVTNLVTELTGSNDDHHLAETLLDELHGVWAEEFERRLEIVENLEALADPSLRGLGSLALPMHDKSGISGSGDGWAEGWFDDGDVDGDLF